MEERSIRRIEKGDNRMISCYSCDHFELIEIVYLPYEHCRLHNIHQEKPNEHLKPCEDYVSSIGGVIGFLRRLGKKEITE